MATRRWKIFDDRPMIIRFDTTHERDRQTDTHTHTDRQADTAWRHRPRLCIASWQKPRETGIAIWWMSTTYAPQNPETGVLSKSILLLSAVHSCNTRHLKDYHTLSVRTTKRSKSLRDNVPSVWNSLPAETKLASSLHLGLFTKRLKSSLITMQGFIQDFISGVV